MKYLIYTLFLVLFCSCVDEKQPSGRKNNDGSDVTAVLPKESKAVLDKIERSAVAGQDSLLVDDLNEFKCALSEYINDSKFQEANDLRIAVQNYLEQSCDIAKMAEKNSLLMSEVNGVLNLPEIKEQTLTSVASVLNVAGVVVEEKTLRKAEEAQAENSTEEGMREEVLQPTIEEEPLPHTNDANT